MPEKLANIGIGGPLSDTENLKFFGIRLDSKNVSTLIPKRFGKNRMGNVKL